jgi:hypothetical protein
MDNKDRQITRKIEAWRDALIDLSKRNPLLSLPKTVVRLEASADDLWKLPPTGKRGAFRLLPLPVNGTLELGEGQAAAAATTGVEASATPSGARRLVPLPPRTQYATDDVLKRLGNLRQKARLSLTEQGINVLFVTIGTLEWRDP